MRASLLPQRRSLAAQVSEIIAHEARSVALAQQVCERWRVPVDCRELAELTAREHGNIHRSAGLNATALVRLFERCDAWRRPDRFGALLLACECDARGRLGREHEAYEPRPRLGAALEVARAIDTATVAQAAAERGLKGPQVGAAIAQARAQALRDRGLAE